MLDVARRDAQDLHQKISENIANIERTTDADFKIVSDKAHALGERLKADAMTQNEKVKGFMLNAAEKLKAAPQQAKDNLATGAARLKQANLTLLDGSHAAAQSISHAVAELRGQATAASPAPAN
ncbi:hypothetical protein GCM10008023_39180 [Sphingomonas glacialis]|uniref:Phasin family protein n=2 Tax=Sphingomonas glacialis TaxID=658225 RepID=A0ABQ3LZP4_9SPHN|nr:hypothetical protein GCM10008023_39180 [Sphingomonas glacialis]